MFGGVDTNHVLIGLVVALSAVGVLAVHLSARSKARRVVHGRSPLSAADFGALFANEAEAALAPVIRDRLRAYIPVDPALVRPDDKLCEELQLAALDGLDANAFMAEVEKVVGTRIPAKDAEGMSTLRDVVSYLAACKQ